jgi:DNA-binding MarR family transcriptional regulator/N-acetylglutamate synthase-like GNAT family acetyltransferase
MEILEANTDAQVESIRRFNRFYTKQIGVLREGLLRSSFSLTQVRVLYELAHRERVTASELGQELELDAGYLSRILRAFEKRGLVARKQSKADGRQFELRLTRIGRTVFQPLERRSCEEVARMLSDLPPHAQSRLIEAMSTIEELLGKQPESRLPYLLRTHQPGDMGWVVYRHGILYSQEYGWDEHFEALVAEIVAKFVRDFDPKRERCWIAERNGENAGCVFLVKESASVAKLRLLLVEPTARGLGMGKRLVSECIRFARQAGYQRLTLWTNDILTAARCIYEKEGFRLVHEERHHSFGRELTGQNWDLQL